MKPINGAESHSKVAQFVFAALSFFQQFIDGRKEEAKRRQTSGTPRQLHCRGKPIISFQSSTIQWRLMADEMNGKGCFLLSLLRVMGASAPAAAPTFRYIQSLNSAAVVLPVCFVFCSAMKKRQADCSPIPFVFLLMNGIKGEWNDEMRLS